MESRNSDILIIGGGIIGLSIARAIRRRSPVPITVLDCSAVGREASWAAAGMLAPNAEQHANSDLQDFCVRSLELYPQFVDELELETGVGVGFELNGIVETATNDDDARALRKKFETLPNLGITAEFVTGAEIQKVESCITPAAEAAIFYPNEGQVDNRLLVSALKKYAAEHAITVREHSAAEAPVRTDGSGLTILAAGAWSGGLLGPHFDPSAIRPIRGQMIGFQAAERAPKRVIYGADGYILGRADGRILAGATVEDVGFSRVVDPKSVSALRSKASRIMPTLASLAVDSAWAGLRPKAFDGLPVLGEHPEYDNFLIATGHYRNGILLAPITAEIVAELVIDGRRSHFFDLFSPARLPRRSAAAN